jgi:hypothetical protein
MWNRLQISESSFKWISHVRLQAARNCACFTPKNFRNSAQVARIAHKLHFDKNTPMHIGTLSLPLDLWCLGFVVMANLMTAWFFSNFPQHLWNLLYPDGEKVYTKDDLMTRAMDRCGAVGDLWICPMCLGTWMSFIVSTVASVLASQPLMERWQFMLTATFTWPVCFYLLYGILKRV